MTLAIGSLTFAEDGQSVVFTFMDTHADVRNRGLVTMTHQLAVLRGRGAKDYGDEMDELARAALALLVDALEDYRNTEPHEWPDDDDDDD